MTPKQPTMRERMLAVDGRRLVFHHCDQCDAGCIVTMGGRCQWCDTPLDASLARARRAVADAATAAGQCGSTVCPIIHPHRAFAAPTISPARSPRAHST